MFLIYIFLWKRKKQRAKHLLYFLVSRVACGQKEMVTANIYVIYSLVLSTSYSSWCLELRAPIIFNYEFKIYPFLPLERIT